MNCCLVAKLCPTHCDPMDYTHEAPLSIGFPRQEYQNWLSFHFQGNLPNPGVEPMSPAVWEADSLPLSLQGIQ